jgi:hypothetical protein
MIYTYVRYINCKISYIRIRHTYIMIRYVLLELRMIHHTVLLPSRVSYVQ